MNWIHQPCGQLTDFPRGTDPASTQTPCPHCAVAVGGWERLAWANRRLLAERWHWPAGVLEECERLDREYPRWAVMWRQECRRPGGEQTAGFHAVMVDARISWWTAMGWADPWVDAPDARQIDAEIQRAQTAVEVEERRRAQPMRSVIRRQSC